MTGNRVLFAFQNTECLIHAGTDVLTDQAAEIYNCASKYKI